MATRRKAYHHGNLPAEIRAAALELIEAQGRDGFTLREAARKVGVTHTAVYKHFEDKETLLAAIAEEGFTELSERMEQARARRSSILEELEAIGVAYVRFALERPAHYQVMFGPRLNRDGRFPALEAAVMRALAALKEPVERGLAKGAIHGGGAREIAFSLWSVAHGFAALAQNERIVVKNDAKALRFFATLLAPLLRGLQ